MRWVSLLGLAVSLVLSVACGDDDPIDDTSDACSKDCNGGDGGRGGAGPNGRGGTGGGGTAGGGTGGSKPDCGAGSLEDYCRNRDCVDSPKAALDRICSSENFRGYHVESNECGGKTVNHIIANDRTQYHFDAMDRLIGITFVGDTPRQGCTEHFKTYGRMCTSVSPRPQTSCDDRDAGGDDAGT